MEKPPFQLSHKILNLALQIQEMVGLLRAHQAVKPSLRLRKENKIRTVRSSLAIEGNSLSESRVTDILENKRVVGPQKQILEVKNALSVYDQISNYNPLEEKDLLRAPAVVVDAAVSDF